MNPFKNRERILDVREERTGATPFEFREDAATGYVILRGYAATYEPYDCYGGPDAGGWVEQLRANSFDRTLQANPDVMLLLNHTGAPLARTKSGTMTLSADRRGLIVEARLDPSDPDVQALLPKMRRGDLDEMSFAFRVKDQEWDANYTHRTITEVSLQKGDVSVVNYGMNPNTRVAIAEGTVGALASLSGRQLAELRRLDGDLIDRAIDNLNRAKDSAMLPQEKDAMDDEDKDKYGMDCDDQEEKGGFPFGKAKEDDDEEDDEEKKSSCEDDEEREDDCTCGETPCVCGCDDDEPVRVNAGVASALEASLLTAYSLAKDNPACQRKLKEARAQLSELRGQKDGLSSVDTKLLALRKECGLPKSSNVEDALDYIKKQGIDPTTSLPYSWNNTAT
jgi:HK97 family phage prohead protease